MEFTKEDFLQANEAFAHYQKMEHFIKDLVKDKMFYQKMLTQLILNEINDYAQIRAASQTLCEACHFCDMSLKERIKPLTSKERAIRKFGWKFDIDSLLYASSGMMGALKDFRTRQFLDDARECVQSYGEYRHYDDLLWGWSGDQ
jgi:hypothetical protein